MYTQQHTNTCKRMPVQANVLALKSAHKKVPVRRHGISMVQVIIYMYTVWQEILAGVILGKF